MLTGDKGETAKNIAISCGLIDQMNTHKLITINGGAVKVLEDQFDKALFQVENCD